MRNWFWAIAIAALGLSGMAVPVRAHHSFSAAYNMEQPVTVKGVIANVRLQNPHSWFFIDVKDESGSVKRWAFEAGTPSGMIRNGFKPNEIKQGVEVIIKGYHARDAAQNMGMLSELTTPDGKVYSRFGPQEGGSR
jgi:hypothetical protein